MRRFEIACCASLMALPLLGCSGDPAGTGSSGGTTSGGPAAGPTFHKDIEPILQKSCQSCHAPGKIAPFSLLAYSDAKTVAGLMAQRTAEHTMPPWGAQETTECQPRLGWKDDKRLSDAEIALFKTWSDAGAPEGNPADAPPKLPDVVDGLPGATKTVEPLKPFVAGGDNDQFRCFSLDPGITQVSYLNGSHFVAGNPKVVHHALMFLDPDGQGAALADADGGYDCFGGPGVDKATLIAAWAPGGVPNEYPSNVGLIIPAGAKLVMQIHYHPAGVTSAAPDSTKFQMRFTAGAPEYLAAVSLIGNYKTEQANGDGLLPGPDDPGGSPAFLIPANVKGHTETMRLTLPAKLGGQPLPELRVLGVASHMHYVGTDMMISMDRNSATGSEVKSECLLQTPKWDFNWQRFYDYDATLDALPTVRAGDVLHLRCTYDNTTGNPFVQKALQEQKLAGPQDVKLGETTLDEMCLAGVNFVYKAP